MHCQMRKVCSQGAAGELQHLQSRAFSGTRKLLALQKCNTYLIRTGDARAPRGSLRAAASSVKASSPIETQSLSLWNGSDDFTCCNDRIDAPPLPLPSISEPVRVVIVRHGQSTWNAEGRIQGSTDLSVLTEKGVKQAQKTRDMLSSMRFSRVFQSPLTRARQTADVVLQGREEQGAVGSETGRLTLPSLREVDLYQFQGLLKHEGKALYGEQYKRWQKAPHEFELDGHAPVRELWYRASMAWQMLLSEEPSGPLGGGREVEGQGGSASSSSSEEEEEEEETDTDPRVVLVVAHNAINQALVATALGLPPSYFRRLPQNNAALSIFDLEPGADGSGSGGGGGGGDGDFPGPRPPPPQIILSCLNQSPDNPFKNPDKVVAHVVLVTPPDTTAAAARAGGDGGPETATESSSAAELRSLAAVLSKLQVTHVLAGHDVSADTVSALLEGQPPRPPPPPQQQQPLASSEEQQGSTADTEKGVGGAAAVPVDQQQQQQQQQLLQSGDVVAVDGAGSDSDSGYGAVDVERWMSTESAAALWVRAVELAATTTTTTTTQQQGDGRQSYGNVLVVLDEESHVGVLWAALGLAGGSRVARLRVSPGGLSVIEFAADPRVTPATVRCINNTAHAAAVAPARA
ncbi:hypothetical protein PLESTB_001385600 [Pleodorina starrii]|uniref:Phosphoglycerate mutase n=1 Tax=Pleodorina starrii TaxID=330485 RepID=A0A9W6F653_9CHLO|nr:hypothetical protein PLESTM_000946600 [Pleodorina starrii]GLC57733.1 hypothetical protein PLESTB_001258800 [Pleodorina starrii]GLC58662.1 hypothetical protein PLESTB_001385600 [Pleodorina starrii]